MLDKTRFTMWWQLLLLPLMSSALVVLAAFFFYTTLGQLSAIQDRIADVPTIDLEGATALLKADQSLVPAQRLEFARLAANLMLERFTIERRYHQANALLVARLWTKYIGFVTGMILAFVGAVFILGKIEERPSSVQTASESFKFSMTSTSPGLFLCAFGTVLMIVTIFVNPAIEVTDLVTYVGDPARGRKLGSANFEQLMESASEIGPKEGAGKPDVQAPPNVFIEKK